MRSPVFAVMEKDGSVTPVAGLMDPRLIEQMEKPESRTVLKTSLGPGNGKVSTVFLGINHQWFDGPPLWFETMVFGGLDHGFQRRYETYEQALEGHKEIVYMVRQGARAPWLIRFFCWVTGQECL